MSLNLVYDRTEEDETSAAAIRSAYQKLGNWSGLTDAERAQLERGALTYNTLNRVEQAVKTLAAALTSAGYPVEVTPVMKGRSRVPSGFTEVEWIQSSGTQYIDSGFKPNQNTKIEADVKITNTSCHVFGARNSYLNKAFALFWLSNSDLAVQVANQTFNGGTFDTSARHTVTMTATELRIDGTATATYSASDFQCEQNAWLMSCYSSSASEYAQGQLFSAKIYDGDSLIREFIPCKNPSGTAGLYDLVGGEFYGNFGTGSFTAGAEVGKAEDREWQEGDVLYRPQWTTYLDNVQRLRDAYYTLAETGQLPAPEDKLNYTGANNIEKVLADINLLLDGMKSIYRRAGTFTAGGNYLRQLIRSI